MAHPDLDDLLNEMLPFAQDMLAKRGEFYPFACSMRVSGEIVYVGGDTGEEHPRSQDVIDLMTAGLNGQARRGEIRAAGVCLDVRVIPPGQSNKTDAICARLEHLSGEAVHVFLPYHKSMLGKYKFSDLFATEGTRDIFEGHQ